MLGQVATPAGDAFAGLDISHSFLDTRVPKLLSKELTENALGLQLQEGCGRGLVTLRPLPEAGDVEKLLSGVNQDHIV